MAITILLSYVYFLNVLGSADRNLYPVPAYCNPIPWKPVHVPPPKEDRVLAMKRSQRPVFCQPHASLPVVISKPRSNLCRKKL